MMPTFYDNIADEYAAIANEQRDPDSVVEAAVLGLFSIMGDVAGLVVCDLCCGEGHLSRRLAENHDCLIVGVDTSARLLQIARERTSSSNIRFVLEDAQKLESLSDSSFDLVVNNLALMDIQKLDATYAAVFRILRPGGRFAFSLMHPCFQIPHRPVVGTSPEEGGEVPIRYNTEGFWRSDYVEGVRGRVGAHHRTLSTYLNSLVRAGLSLGAVQEPPVALRLRDGKLVPSVLVVLAEKSLARNLEG